DRPDGAGVVTVKVGIDDPADACRIDVHTFQPGDNSFLGGQLGPVDLGEVLTPVRGRVDCRAGGSAAVDDYVPARMRDQVPRDRDLVILGEAGIHFDVVQLALDGAGLEQVEAWRIAHLPTDSWFMVRSAASGPTRGEQCGFPRPTHERFLPQKLADIPN